MEVKMYTTIVIGSWVVSPAKKTFLLVWSRVEMSQPVDTCNDFPLSDTDKVSSSSAFYFTCLPDKRSLSKGTKSVTVVCFFNPRSMKLPATFQPLFTGGEFSDVLWHTERGMSRIYLHSHPFQLGTLNFWGDFRWVWICGGIVLRSLKVYFAACLGMLMKQPTVSFPISMGSNDFHMIPGHSANFQLSQLRFAKVKQAKVLVLPKVVPTGL